VAVVAVYAVVAEDFAVSLCAVVSVCAVVAEDFVVSAFL
jgi:hypothetical protein